MTIRSAMMGGVVCVAVALLVAPANGQHSGDVWVGVDSNGHLAVSPAAFVPADNYSQLLPASGLLNGWTNDDPGFDHLAADDPGSGIYRLAAGASVWLEVVELAPAFQAIDDGFQLLDAPGDDTLLGDETLHEHITWHIDSNDPAFDSAQCVWPATFVLRDEGSTGYMSSETLTFLFTNVAVRAAGVSATGDFDEDADVDLDDHAALVVCLFGPAIVPQPDDPAVTTCEVECLNAFDFDDDRDVDLADYAALQRVY